MADIDNTLLVVGTGAMATFFAARLSRAGIRVIMLGSWKAGLVALGKEGARLDDQPGQPVLAVNDPANCPRSRYALVLVKSWQTEEAANHLLQCLDRDGLVVTLQNGLGNAEILSNKLGSERVSSGLTTFGATILEPGHVHFGGDGKIIFENKEKTEGFCSFFQRATLPAERVENIESFLWGKLVINSAINPLTALLQVKNGELLKNPDSRSLMIEIALESAAVAEKCGIELPYPDVKTEIENIARKSADNISSMLQDIRRKARTEVDAINGSVVRAAAALHMLAPFNQTMQHLINALSFNDNI